MSTLADDQVRYLATRMAVTDEDVAAAVERIRPSITSLDLANAWLAGTAGATLTILALDHIGTGCTGRHCVMCARVRDWLSVALACDRLVPRRCRRAAPVEDREHYDRDDPVTGAPLPAGRGGYAVGAGPGRHTGEHPIVPAGADVTVEARS